MSQSRSLLAQRVRLDTTSGESSLAPCKPALPLAVRPAALAQTAVTPSSTQVNAKQVYGQANALALCHRRRWSTLRTGQRRNRR